MFGFVNQISNTIRDTANDIAEAVQNAAEQVETQRAEPQPQQRNQEWVATRCNPNPELPPPAQTSPKPAPGTGLPAPRTKSGVQVNKAQAANGSSPVVNEAKRVLKASANIEPGHSGYMGLWQEKLERLETIEQVDPQWADREANEILRDARESLDVARYRDGSTDPAPYEIDPEVAPEASSN